jgi:hypothetical protein
VAKRKDFLCEDCDWIGSPEMEVEECPCCGGIDLAETGTDLEDDGLE